MEFELKERTILLTIAGSRAYGMHTPTSDVDVKGICIPPSNYRNGFLRRFEQADKKEHMKTFFDLLEPEEQEKCVNGELEGSVYDIRKFFDLASQNNPNILDALFCRDQEVRFISKEGTYLRDNANMFLSTKCRWTFGGYAKAQLKRINSHRQWLLNPPTHKPTREEFGLPKRTLIPADQLAAAQDAIKKKIDSWEVDYGSLDESEKIYIQDQMSQFWSEMKLGADEKFASAARNVGYDENFIHLLDLERRYRGAMVNYNQYMTWKNERNKARAALEAKYGFDSKHGAHLVRLLRMCKEILRDGVVNVHRDDAEELLAIRNGAWTYDKLMEFVEVEEKLIDEAYRNSILPRTPDRTRLDEICCELVENYK